MSKDEDQFMKLFEQIRNLLIVQMLNSGVDRNDDISRVLGVTHGRISQIYSKSTKKK